MKGGRIITLLAVAALLAWAAPMAAAQERPSRPYWWGRVEALAQRDGYNLLRPAELKALYDQGAAMVVIDARTAHEFKAGHLPGAGNVEFHMGHVSSLDKAKERELRDAIGPDNKRRVVVYDRGLQCVRSQMAAQWAVNLGYENVWMLPEGWMGWLSLTQQKSALENESRAAAAGKSFPFLRLTLLDGKRDRTYLNLPDKAKVFALDELKADYVLIELYNELCFACCQSVPELNQLLGLIEKEPMLAGRVKMIGIGVGNLNRDVHRFRQEKNVGFPLFSDPTRDVHKRLGEPALPIIYLVRLRGPTGISIVSLRNAPFESAEALLRLIKMSLRADVKPKTASSNK